MLGLCVAGNGVSADEVESPVDAGELLREYERLESLEEPPLPEIQQRPDRPPLRSGEGQTVEIREITFSGATELVDIREVRSLVAEAIGMELDFTGLEQLAFRVTDYLKAQGWFLARAYLPQQDLTDGVLEIVILAGDLSDEQPVDVLPGQAEFDRVVPEQIRRMVLGALSAGEAVREENVNRAVLLTSDLPGVSTQSRLRPGPETGTTTIEMIVDEGPLVSGQVRADNYGSDSTGTERVSATARVNNLSGVGDRISLASTRNEGSDLYRATWSLPVGVQGLRLDLGVTNLQYEVITDAGQRFDIGGRTRTNIQTLSYPVVRSRTHNLNLSLSGRQQRMQDRADGEETANKRKNSVTLELDSSRLDNFAGGGRTTWRAGLVAGQLDLKNNAEAFSQDQQTYQTHGAFQKVTLSGSRLQQITDQTTAYARFSGQYTDQNLDSSEQLSLGGLAGVRGYPGGEAGGDNAAILQLEVRHSWPFRLPGGISVNTRVFLDSGWVQLREDPGDLLLDTATERNTYTLHGTGMALTLAKPGVMRLNAVWGRSIGDNPGRSVDGTNADGTTDRNQFYLQASARF